MKELLFLTVLILGAVEINNAQSFKGINIDSSDVNYCSAKTRDNGIVLGGISNFITTGQGVFCLIKRIPRSFAAGWSGVTKVKIIFAL